MTERVSLGSADVGSGARAAHRKGFARARALARSRPGHAGFGETLTEEDAAITGGLVRSAAVDAALIARRSTRAGHSLALAVMQRTEHLSGVGLGAVWRGSADAAAAGGDPCDEACDRHAAIKILHWWFSREQGPSRPLSDEVHHFEKHIVPEHTGRVGSLQSALILHSTHSLRRRSQRGREPSLQSASTRQATQPLPPDGGNLAESPSEPLPRSMLVVQR